MSTNDESSMMKETQEAPDYGAKVREEMAEMEARRGLVAAELDACEAGLQELYGPITPLNRGRCSGERSGAISPSMPC